MCQVDLPIQQGPRIVYVVGVRGVALMHSTVAALRELGEYKIW